VETSRGVAWRGTLWSARGRVARSCAEFVLKLNSPRSHIHIVPTQKVGPKAAAASQAYKILRKPKKKKKPKKTAGELEKLSKKGKQKNIRAAAATTHIFIVYNN